MKLSPHPIDGSNQPHGCTIAVRRIEGPEAREIFLHCQPPAEVKDAGRQADAIYRSILAALEAEGAGFQSVVSEMVFLRELHKHIGFVREARQRVLAANGDVAHRPATTEIGQPPLNEHACLEVSVQAVIPHESRPRVEVVEAEPACGCAECARAHGLRIHVGAETRFHAAGLCGPGDNAYEQTLGMFTRAEELLRKAGMEFSDVVRTWIHLRDIDRDYAELNRARRAFFEARGIDPVPASTGIGGGPVSEVHDLCLGVYAVKAGKSPVRTVMTSPTLNEAPQYGADFVRGMRMVETNKVALHVSGTASIDEYGRTAHRDDFESQADRMLVNIAALLEGQGASFGDVVSAITYLKRPEDAARLREKIHEAGFEGFPNALVGAPICRSDLLCETEVLAVLTAGTNMRSSCSE
ncbi:MAG: Rid family hydrolase [Chromatiales bacterium]